MYMIHKYNLYYLLNSSLCSAYTAKQNNKYNVPKDQTVTFRRAEVQEGKEKIC